MHVRSRPRLQIGVARRKNGSHRALDGEGTPMPSQRSKYTQDTVDAIGRRFDAAPPAPKLPNRFGPPALVRTLAPKIRQMVDKGYTWEAMAQMMAADGVTIRPNVLRKYAAGLLDQPKAKRKTKGRGRPLAPRLPSAPGATPATAMGTTQPANGAGATDDAWDLAPVEENHRVPDVLPPGGRSQVPSVVRPGSAQVTAGRSPSPSPKIRPDTEDL
jgi:hypothetical protein